MSKIIMLSIIFTLHLLLFNPIHQAMARHYPILPSAPSTALPIASKAGDYVTMTPYLNHKQRVFHRQEVKNCMPKGLRRSSTPSRYVNYHTVGLRCLPGKNSPRP
ncbi:hypothetical protein CDL12_23919 [Handroanthus impetiginosus]|uniref:Neprosin activation peptide domain-containing protein n=1 Tax=Handroanthus impetiginosus TaxID=429701 RepID=A0A2G9GE34_9LAMI|nr:hypothetical protein CDL12_23919 [Handroanthus impetiginosus]